MEVYSRFAEDSEVYVYRDMWGGLVCCSCALSLLGGDICLWQVEEMLEHLRKHRRAGHEVPDYVFERIVEDD